MVSKLSLHWVKANSIPDSKTTILVVKVFLIEIDVRVGTPWLDNPEQACNVDYIEPSSKMKKKNSKKKI